MYPFIFLLSLFFSPNCNLKGYLSLWKSFFKPSVLKRKGFSLENTAWLCVLSVTIGVEVSVELKSVLKSFSGILKMKVHKFVHLFHTSPNDKHLMPVIKIGFSWVQTTLWLISLMKSFQISKPNCQADLLNLIYSNCTVITSLWDYHSQ